MIIYGMNYVSKILFVLESGDTELLTNTGVEWDRWDPTGSDDPDLVRRASCLEDG